MSEKNKRTFRWFGASALALTGLLIAWLWDASAQSLPGSTGCRVVGWPLRQAPVSNWRHVFILDDLVCTNNWQGSLDFGPWDHGILELRLYAKRESTCPPDWTLAWVPVEVNDPDAEAYLLSLEAFLNTNRLRGELESWDEGFRVVWRLPQPARKVRIGVPAHSSLRIAWLEAVIPHDLRAWQAEAMQRRVYRVWGVGLGLAAWLLAVMVLAPHVCTVRMLHGFLVAATVASLMATIFWLPPFQGPDEPDHWRDALGRYRRHAVEETMLYNLPEIAGFDRVRWRAEAHVSATMFRQTAPEIRPLAEPKWVNYAGYYSYPTVALVAWLFPRVETVQEALLFYYMCRLVPAMVLAGLLYWAWRADAVPALALAVLSSPYVQQQCVIISTDTLANLAALSAGLLWLSLQRNWAWSRYTGLWVAALLAFLAKPPVYGLLFGLPLLATPWQRWRMRSVLVLGTVVVLGALVIVLAWRGYQAMHRVPVAEQFRQQWQFFWYEGGWRYFWQEPLPEAFRIPRQLQNWFMPLGWVDTLLHPYHVGFLRTLVLVALATDMARALLYASAWCTLRNALRLALIAAFLAVLFAGTWTLTAIVMYLAVTPPRNPFIYGMQVRYLFPCLLAGLWLPLGIAKTAECASANITEQEKAEPRESSSQESSESGKWRWPLWRDWLDRIIVAGWAALFTVLTAGRLVGLTADLLARYW